MSYNKTNWSNGATALSAENFNHIENGLQDVSDMVDAGAIPFDVDAQSGVEHDLYALLVELGWDLDVIGAA